MRNFFDIKDKVVLITGGTGVLGSCMAEYLAEQGAKVVILARNEANGKKLVDSILEKGNEAFFVKSDVNDEAVLRENAATILAKYGTIDVLVNGAGGNMPGATIPPDKSFFNLNINDFKTVVDLNLFGTVIPTMVFGEVMAQNKKGVIINISSESAIRPLTRVVGYGVAKAAVTNFTKYLATELATKYGEGLRVNALAPGFFISEQNRTLLTNPDGTLTARGNTIVSHTPFGRFGEPDELLGTLHYLASDASKFVTGTMIVVDGGFDAFCI